MSRYKVVGSWSEEKAASVDGVRFSLQSATIVDKQDGHQYSDGGWRVTVGGKAPCGKGGTVPFYGESAWSDGERFYGDIVTKARYAR